MHTPNGTHLIHSWSSKFQLTVAIDLQYDRSYIQPNAFLCCTILNFWFDFFNLYLGRFLGRIKPSATHHYDNICKQFCFHVIEHGNLGLPKFISLSHAKKYLDIFNILAVVRYRSFVLT